MRKLHVALAGLMLAAAMSASAGPPLKPGQITILPSFGYILVRLDADQPVEVLLNRFTMQHSVVSIVPQQFDSRSTKEFDVATIGGPGALATEGRKQTYLVLVRPGYWLVGLVGETCFSLGTYGFEVRPGEVTDIGTLVVGREDGKSPVPEIAAAALSPDLAAQHGLTGFAMLARPATDADGTPREVAGARVVRASYYRDLRFPNIYGTLVNRALDLPPMAHIASLRPTP